MRQLVFALVAPSLLLLAQAVARPAALEERADWPPGDEQKALIVKYAAPLIGRETTADILWAKTLVYYGGSHVEEGSDFRYLEAYLDAIIELDPRFKRVYSWAAYAMTYQSGPPTQDEYRASLKYLFKGMKEFPDEPDYPWLAGMRYYFDLQSDDPEVEREYRERGADLIEQAMRKPNAPASYTGLAASLRSKLGQHERAMRNLQQTILTTSDEAARRTMLDKLRFTYKRPDFAEELERETRKWQQAWERTMPYAPPTLFVIFGEEPDRVINFDDLATDRDLFGSWGPEPVNP